MAEYDMRSIIEQLLPSIFSKFASKSFFSAQIFPGGLPEDLFKDLQMAVSSKQLQILQRWETYFAISLLKALSSHKMYVRYLMFMCEIVTGLEDNVFDALISVCALVMMYTMETLETSGVNFCQLATDIIMEFYEMNLKEPFYWFGGFESFAIYMVEKYSWETSDFEEDSVVYRLSLEKKGENRIRKVFEKTRMNPEDIKHEEVLSSADCLLLAEKVLFFTKAELPILPNSEKITELVSSRLKDLECFNDTSKLSKTKVAKGSKSEEILLTAHLKFSDILNVSGNDSQCYMTELDSKQELAEGDALHETTPTESEPVTTDGHSESKTTTSDEEATDGHSKSETTAKTLDEETIATPLDEETTDRHSESEATATDLDEETTDRHSESETTALDEEATDGHSKSETTATTLDEETTDIHSESETTETASDEEATDEHSKSETTATLARETKTTIPKRGTSDEDSKCETTATVSKQETTGTAYQQFSNLQGHDLKEIQTNIASYEKTVQQAITYNNSICLQYSGEDKQILDEASDALETVREIIKTLIKELDKKDSKFSYHV